MPNHVSSKSAEYGDVKSAPLELTILEAKEGRLVLHMDVLICLPSDGWREVVWLLCLDLHTKDDPR